MAEYLVKKQIAEFLKNTREPPRFACHERCTPDASLMTRRALEQIVVIPAWWSQSGSNRRPSRCKRDALPAELWPRPAEKLGGPIDPGPDMVGLGGVEPPTSPLSGVRSNQLSYRPGGQRTYAH